MDDHDFCRVLLKTTRTEAKKCRPAIHGRAMSEVQFMPSGLTAMRVMRDHFLVEGSGSFTFEVTACCAWEARAKALTHWMNKTEAARRETTNG